jgi:N-acetylmuramic acid 6-phosphate etherase
LVDFPITVLTGPEVIAGSTRLKAGTATKLVLNTISTAAMIRMGYVYGNLMVNVQPRNAKLEARAIRIIASATGVSPARAAELLALSGENVKTAIVMGRLEVDRKMAEQRLAEAGGHIAGALAGGNQ